MFEAFNGGKSVIEGGLKEESGSEKMSLHDGHG